MAIERQRSAATLRDVAERAGVGIKTASRVLNNEPGVRLETAAKVTAAAVALGFRANRMARNLRTGASTTTLGLVIGDMGNPFFASIARGVEMSLSASGYLLVIASHGEDPDREGHLVQELAARRVDALMVVPAPDSGDAIAHEVARGLPVVVVDRSVEHRGLAVDEITLDNEGGAHALVSRLIADGHHRIGMVSDLDHLWTAERRRAGYRHALKDAGLPSDGSLVISGAHTPEEAYEAARMLLHRHEPPTAIFAINNLTGRGVLRAVEQIDPSVEVAMFDDVDTADLFRHEVTLASYDPVAMGRAAAGYAWDRLNGYDGPPRRVMLPIGLRRVGGALPTKVAQAI